MKTKIVITLLSLILCQIQMSSCRNKGDNTGEENQIPTTPAAASYIAQCIDDDNDKLYVYKNFGDGRNVFTQKSWMGATNIVSPMDEQVLGFSGTGIAAEFDISQNSWGGYMMICGILVAGKSVPESNFGDVDAGFDLTGATKLVFYACGDEGGEKIEFILAGISILRIGEGGMRMTKYPDSSLRISSGVITLSKKWKKYEINLKNENLSRIACGFGWVANNLNKKTKVRFYMDEIYYQFDSSRKAPVFLKSYEDMPQNSDEATINSVAYLYDNAAAAMVLSYEGKHEHARQIADAIVYAVDNDRYYSDGRLHNAYLNGNVESFPGWMSAKNRPFARMFGFYDTRNSAWNEDVFANSSATGNMAWAVMALCEVYYNSKQQKYLSAAQKIGDFILTLKAANGGFTGGYEGWEGSETKHTYLSTEHNIDLITAYSMLFGLTRDVKYQEASVSAKNFVLSMYDSQKKCFYTGTGSDGVTVSRDVLPLDCNTWALLALKDEFNEAHEVMNFIEQNMSVKNTKGYDFNNDRDGVWYEGTAQVALAYLLAADNKAKYDEIMAYLNECALPDGSIYAANKDNVTTGFMVGSTAIVWKYNRRVHLGATAWLAFAQLGKNPFDAEKFHTFAP